MRPAELVDQRCQEHRRVGGTAGDHDVGAARQRLDDRPGAEIGVGRDQPVTQRAHRLPGLVQAVVAGAHRVEDVVAGDGGDPDAAQPERAGDRLARSVAAPSGLAAPMLVMIRMPLARQPASTARIRSASSGS